MHAIIISCYLCLLSVRHAQLWAATGHSTRANICQDAPCELNLLAFSFDGPNLPPLLFMHHDASWNSTVPVLIRNTRKVCYLHVPDVMVDVTMPFQTLGSGFEEEGAFQPLQSTLCKGRPSIKRCHSQYLTVVDWEVYICVLPYHT